MAPETPFPRLPVADVLPDVLIAGAGIIGLSLALELRWRGATVTVLQSGLLPGGASTAAAGMLAAEDPHNLPALLPLSRYSLSLYARFLARIEALSQQSVPFQTSTTVQYRRGHPAQLLAEHSIDPRQLAPALRAAAFAASVRLVESAAAAVHTSPAGVQVHTAAGESFGAHQFVHATGAWGLPGPNSFVNGCAAVTPRKGQMLRIAMPADAPLLQVHRAEHVYVVPRTLGPQAGTAVIGATVEDTGFEVSTDAAQLQRLREAAAALSAETAFLAEAAQTEAWAGLRPSTPDGLPILGRIREREWVATGHFRNGILLAPATADILADLLAGRSSSVDLSPFSPDRFGASR